MRLLSIGQRLTLWYLIIFAAAQLTFGTSMWFILRHSLVKMTDQVLQSQVDDLTSLLKVQKKKNTSISKLQEEVSEAYLPEHSGDYLQLYVGEGTWIYRSSFLEQHALQALEPATANQVIYKNLDLGGRPFRFLSQQVQANGRAYTAQIGLPIDQVVQTLSLFRRYLLMSAPLLLLAAAAGGYWLSGRALSPVDALARTARTISGNNLSARLEQLDTGDELQRLSDTLNEMLGRIETSFLRVTQFTADASHELRTPISLIRTEAEIALQQPRRKAEYRESLRHILVGAERTSALVEGLLNLARADSGAEVLDMCQIDLHAVVAEAGAEWRRVIESRGLYFKDSTAGCEKYIFGDQVAMRRVLSILLDNAVKYTPSPGTIELSLEQKSESVVIAVRDSGIGIAEEDRPRIFERFYRADKSRGNAQGGVGLGLAIAHWIVQRHHGLLAVESHLGSGTAFFLELPLFGASRVSGTKEDMPAVVVA